MICSNQITAAINNKGENAILKNITQVGTNVLLHTGLFTISAITFFTGFWLSLYIIV